MFNCYAAEIPAEICESHEYVYVIYMSIMHARMFGSKIWSLCISAYDMFMHDDIQE